MNARLPRDRKDICAVVTTYRPDETLKGRVEAILRQVGKVVLVDDGARPENARMLRGLFAEAPNLVLHHNSENIGLAASLNQGIKIAASLGFRWVLTLDDDSTAHPDMCALLLAYLPRIAQTKPVAIIAPSWSHKASPPVLQVAEPLWTEKIGVITSGSLMSLDVYDAVGPFRNDFIIDAVDYEYCLRARAAGYGIFRINAMGFQHSLGTQHVRRFGPIRLQLAEHTPMRTYYAFRNSAIVAQKVGAREPRYCCGLVYRYAQQLIAILFCYAHKRQHLKAIVVAVRDALRRNTGRCPYVFV